MDPISKAQSPQNRRSLRGGHSPSIGAKTQFPPGKSGNPGGRPKDTVSGIYRRWLKKKANQERIQQFIEATIDPDKPRMSGVLLIREMTERDEGKVADVVAMNVEGHITLEQVLEARRKSGK